MFAPIDSIPLWFRADSLVPMFARTADTLLPASAPGVTSYADPAYGRELRLVYSTIHRGDVPVASTALHDGARATARAGMVTVTGGTEYTVFTLDVNTYDIPYLSPYAATSGVEIDGVALPAVTSDLELGQCAAPGCWWLDQTAHRFQARVFAATGETRGIVVR